MRGIPLAIAKSGTRLCINKAPSLLLVSCQSFFSEATAKTLSRFLLDGEIKNTSVQPSFLSENRTQKPPTGRVHHLSRSTLETPPEQLTTLLHYLLKPEPTWSKMAQLATQLHWQLSNN